MHTSLLRNECGEVLRHLVALRSAHRTERMVPSPTWPTISKSQEALVISKSMPKTSSPWSGTSPATANDSGTYRTMHTICYTARR